MVFALVVVVGGGGVGVWGDRVILLDKEFFKSDAYSQTLTKHSDV